jgi:Icc-related predicted phosphoesterase
MRILAFSDLHCSIEHARRLQEQAAAVDVVIGAGDFSNMAQGLEIVAELLRRIGKPAVLVAGNGENVEQLHHACRECPGVTILHGTAASIDGVEFYGVGGAIPVTPFGSWSWDFSEEQGRALLADCPERAVLVVHAPPKGVLDISSRGLSVGSVAVRETILAKRPRLAVCGHVHESGGRWQWLGDTPVINAGPAGMVWEL